MPSPTISFIWFIEAKLLDKNKVCWQTGELGKVDIGGGGTIAKYMSQRNIDTVDIGVPVLSMHSPYESAGSKDPEYLAKVAQVFYSK